MRVVFGEEVMGVREGYDEGRHRQLHVHARVCRRCIQSVDGSTYIKGLKA